MTITRDWLQKQIAEFESCAERTDGYRLDEGGKNTLEALRIALASLEAEPVAYMIGGHYLMHAQDPKVDNYASAVPLYTAPPAPVMPDEMDDAGGVCCEVSFADGWNACRAAMLNHSEQALDMVNSPVIQDGWVACSERMPDDGGNYWGWWSESKRQGPVWFIKSELQAQFQSSEITHWQPLPAAPRQESE